MAEKEHRVTPLPPVTEKGDDGLSECVALAERWENRMCAPGTDDCELY